MLVAKLWPLAEDLDVKRLCIASDCLEVINNLKRLYAGEYGMIVSEILATSPSFELIEFRHENRSSNMEAHPLAQGSVREGFGRHLWLLNPPAGFCIPVNFQVNQ